MNIFKLIWGLILSLFRKPKTAFDLDQEAEAKKLDKEVRDKVREGLRIKFMSNSEKRYEWLLKTGYTSRVHIAPDTKPEPEISHYRAMVNKVINIGRALRKDGHKTIHTSEFKNKYGICLMTYFPEIVQRILKENNSTIEFKAVD